MLKRAIEWLQQLLNWIRTGWPKKRAVFCFSSQSCVLQFFQYFSGCLDSRPGKFFWHQYGSKWTLYYAAADKNNRGVLCRKISSSDTAMQERFWQEQCTWWKDNSTFGGQISEERKCGRCSQRPRSLSFGIIPENIQNLRERLEDFPRKSTRFFSQETGISRTSFLRIIHHDLKLFP